MTTTKPHLPISRINTIMKSSSDAEIVSKHSSMLMAKATELFIKKLALEGYKLSKGSKKLDYKHLADVVNSVDKYEFVRDIMPRKITFAEYKKLMLRKNTENNDDSIKSTKQGKDNKCETDQDDDEQDSEDENHISHDDDDDDDDDDDSDESKEEN